MRHGFQWLTKLLWSNIVTNSIQNPCMKKSSLAFDIMRCDVTTISTYRASTNVIGCILKAFHKRKSNRGKKLEQQHAFKFLIKMLFHSLNFWKKKIDSEVLKPKEASIAICKYMFVKNAKILRIWIFNHLNDVNLKMILELIIHNNILNHNLEVNHR